MKNNYVPSQLLKSNDRRRKRLTKGRMVGFRVDDAEFDIIRNKAQSYGLKVATYCRECSMGHRVVDKSEETRRFRNAIIHGLNNLNQIAAHLNRKGLDDKMVVELEALLSKIKEEINNGT